LPQHLEYALSVAATHGALMATLNDLVEAVAGVTGLPRANVFAYGRFARQARMIGQLGRGRSAAEMTFSDAANLLIAVAGTAVTREAGATVKKFRSLKNGRCYFFLPAAEPRSSASIETGVMEFLASYGLRSSEHAGDLMVKIPGDFGGFLEFLISCTLDGKLAQIFRKIPTAEIPSDLWEKWEKNGNPHRDKTVEQLFDEGLITPAPAPTLEFGVHFSVVIHFNRLVPSVEIEFLRDWDGAKLMAAITFGPERGGSALGPHRLQLAAEFTQHTLAAVALVVRNLVRPSSIHTLKAIDYLFAQQFRSEADRAAGGERGSGEDGK
jgi:hypothetical protein